MSKIEHFAGLAPRIVDLSADFRLKNPDDYVRWYGKPHSNPAWLEKFVYGLPELQRAALQSAHYVSGVGCNATATNLAIYPLFANKLVDESRGVICEVKVGSSEGGNASGDSTHHPERAGVMRSFAPTGHRHTAEILQALAQVGSAPQVHLSATAVDNVRGVLATAHLFAKPGTDEKDSVQGLSPGLSQRALRPHRQGAHRHLPLPRAQDPGGQQLCRRRFRVRSRERPHRRHRRHRQPDEGRRRHGGPVHEHHAGLGRDGRTGFPGLHPI